MQRHRITHLAVALLIDRLQHRRQLHLQPALAAVRVAFSRCICSTRCCVGRCVLPGPPAPDAMTHTYTYMQDKRRRGARLTDQRRTMTISRSKTTLSPTPHTHTSATSWRRLPDNTAKTQEKKTFHNMITSSENRRYSQFLRELEGVVEPAGLSVDVWMACWSDSRPTPADVSAATRT